MLSRYNFFESLKPSQLAHCQNLGTFIMRPFSPLGPDLLGEKGHSLFCLPRIAAHSHYPGSYTRVPENWGTERGSVGHSSPPRPGAEAAGWTAQWDPQLLATLKSFQRACQSCPGQSCPQHTLPAASCQAELPFEVCP